MPEEQSVDDREIEYHERLYAGFAQRHFARPAVRELRRHMVSRVIRVTGATAATRVLSLGCGIGDTELLLAEHAAQVVGLDLSPSAVRQARADAARAGRANLRYIQGTITTAGLAPGSFDVVMAIFFLHHVPDGMLEALPRQIYELLAPGGRFYSLDPSRRRLSGAIGSVVVPKLMQKYQSPDERQLDARTMAELFRRAAFETRSEFYDFLSSPLAGLLPGWAWGYRLARRLDNAIIRVPIVCEFGSNFEVVARKL